jgi:hypothetical protein
MLKPRDQRLNKRQIVASFREHFLPSICKTDRIAQWEAFNNYIDSLAKDGMITEWQASNWANPYG